MSLSLPRLSLTAACLLLMLGACQRAGSDGQAANTDPAAPPPMDQPVEDVPPATAPVSTTADSLARFDGYGDLRFGMSADEAKRAWGGELKGTPGEGDVCYYLSPTSNPTPAHFAFMIENGKFVRYDVANDKETAPGGGKRGMTADEIKKLYPGIAEQGHKYVEGGKYLRAKDPAGGVGVVLFETDKDGKVSEWRVGVVPQVGYVEGCS